jgi:O-antigen/teichoic acid export membrane protein
MAERDPYQSRHVRRGIRQFLSVRLIQAVASIAVMVITVRVMSVDDYALYITATALATYLGVVSILGLDRVLTRYVPEGRLKAPPERLIRFINVMNGLRLLAVGGLALAAGLGWHYLAPWVNLPAQDMMLPVLLYAVIHAFMLFQGIVMQSLMLQEGLRNATTATWLLRIGLLAGAIQLIPPLDALAAIWITLASEAVGWLWMARATLRHYGDLRRAMPADDAREEWPGALRDILRFGWHNYLMGQATFPSHARVQQLVAAAFFPPPLVAAFGFFRNLSEQMRNYLPFQLMKNLAEPVMIGRYVQTQDFALLNVMATAMLKLNFLLIAPLTAWLFVAGEPAVVLLTAGKFADQLWMIGILVASQIVSSQLSLLFIAANAIGLSHRLPAATISASAFTVLLLWSQLPGIGIAALVLSDMIFCGFAVLVLTSSMKKAGFRYLFSAGRLLRMATLTLPVAGIGALFMYNWSMQSSALASGITGMVMTASYWGLNMVWKPFSEQERDLLRKLSGKFPIPF